MDHHNNIILLILCILAFSLISFWAGRKTARNGFVPEKPDTVTVTKWIRDSIPVPKDSIIIKYITEYLPVHDTTEVHDTTTIRDSVLVEIPIIEKTYYGENYRATISGFRPELVDIWIKQKETTITVPYRKRWSFTAGPQAGVGFTPKGFQPYAGAGVTFGYSF